MKSARQLLEAERARARRRLVELTGDFDRMLDAARDSNLDDEHDPEGATVAFERSQADFSIRRTEERLAEIDAAFGRLDAGSYGLCERCGEPIPAPRLRARPTARTCVSC